MSFRAFVLVGVVTLVTAFYQPTQPTAFTVTKGLTSRQHVKSGPFPLHSMRHRPLFSGVSSLRHPPSVALSRFGLADITSGQQARCGGGGYQYRQQLVQRARQARTVRH